MSLWVLQLLLTIMMTSIFLKSYDILRKYIFIKHKNIHIYTNVSLRTNSSWSTWCPLLPFLSWFSFCKEESKYNLENINEDTFYFLISLLGACVTCETCM